jgi:hypothetical protein
MSTIDGLYKIWVEQALNIEQDLVQQMEREFSSLKQKESKYAYGVKKMMEARIKVVKIWKKELREINFKKPEKASNAKTKA